MYTFEGHELAFMGTLSGFIAITHNCLEPGWVKHLIHRHPTVAFSFALAGVGVLMPFTIVPIRRALKLPTNQWQPFHADVVFPKYADIYTYENKK